MKRYLRFAAAMAISILIVMLMAVPASALDDTYRFEEFGMSVKAPKSYYVITRDSSRDDDAFKALNLDYDETLTAFRAADIYLRAYDPDGVFQLSLTVSSDEQSNAVNNYVELSDSERKAIMEALQAQPAVTSATEIKRGGNIFFDTTRTSTIEDDPLYINQCNTIINGLQIDISLQKPKEGVTADEAKALENLASSLSFDTISLTQSGPLFDWWRVLLWAAILVALAVAVSIIYRQQNNMKRKRLEERRALRAAAAAEDGDDAQPMTFDEALGYSEGDSFAARASEELDSFEISVREKDPQSGVSYFEDGGESIDDKSDYFDEYFKEPTRTRSGIARLMSKIGAYIGIGFRHIGYFFKNLFNAVTEKKK